jgi:hypothetical protein
MLARNFEIRLDPAAPEVTEQFTSTTIPGGYAWASPNVSSPESVTSCVLQRATHAGDFCRLARPRLANRRRASAVKVAGRVRSGTQRARAGFFVAQSRSDFSFSMNSLNCSA